MDGPLIRFLGTGDAFNSSGRGHQAIVVERSSGGDLLIDAGATVMAAMTRYGLPSDRLDRLFVTHLHGDHIAGWPFLLLHLVMKDRRTRPFEIYGPVGIRERFSALVELCYGEISRKQAFELIYTELDSTGGESREAGGSISYQSFPMQHHPSSLGYQLRFDGISIGVSGDTAWCAGLERLGEGSSTLILECSALAKQESAHLSLEEIRSRRAELGGGEIVLTHLPDEVAESLARDPIAGVLAAHDGFSFTPARDKKKPA